MSRNRKTPETLASPRLGIFYAPKGRTVQSPEVVVAHGWVTSWLNCEMDCNLETRSLLVYSADSRDRILTLLERVRKTLALVISAEDDHGHLWVEFQPIDKLMSRYPIYPTLACHPNTGAFAVMRRIPQESKYPKGETLAAHGIIELARNGRDVLDRLRLCGCGRWFFAKKEASLACSNVCKQKIYDRRPEIKLRKRTQAKANAEWKSGKVHIKGTRRASHLKSFRSAPSA